MRVAVGILIVLSAVSAARAQDQQIGARTKAMGGSYTAFEDDPVSVWLNPAGIATQADAMSIAYQTYTAYPVDVDPGPGTTTVTSVEPESVLADPGFFPSYIGFVFQLGGEGSSMAAGLCIARPYHLNYALDQVSGPTQTAFVPESNVEQSFLRMRATLARDFRFQEVGQSGALTHLAVGVGLDVGYETWEFQDSTGDVRDTATSFGFGLGILLALYDNVESFRVNLGVAYQSAMAFDFDISPALRPAFDMPMQLNVGMTFYLLPRMPLRLTVDLQWIQWSETAQDPLYPGHPGFEDVVNVSFGAEYRLPLTEKLSLIPRVGIRRFDAPWDDEDDLPMTAAYKLVLDTNAEAFFMVTFGAGLTWTTAGGGTRSLDLGVDFGGDSPNVAVGYTHEF